MAKLDNNKEEKDKPVWIYPPELKDIYSNSLNVAVSLYDFMLEFGLLQPDGIVPQVRIRMSPQHAWVMSHILQRNLAIYLEKIGSFELPEEFLKEKDLLDAYNEEIRGKKSE